MALGEKIDQQKRLICFAITILRGCARALADDYVTVVI